MSTPLRQGVEDYLARNAARFHTPGHKGAPLWPLNEAVRYDITEVAGTDSLYEAREAIAESEKLYSGIYGSAGSFFSAGGATLCVQAMLALAAGPGSRIICGRGVHTAAVNAMALLDLHPHWVYPAIDPLTGLSEPVTPGQVEQALFACPDAAAVYLTSPDYFGRLGDIGAIAGICRDHGVPLLVDNAHGPHLRFLSPDLHPLALGADMCCDSMHKTLPVLTGGAVLHVGDPALLPRVREKMSLFGSTSPSYLILLSLDGAIPYLRERAGEDFARISARVAELEQLGADRGFLLPCGPKDPARLSLGFAPFGLSSGEFRQHLERHGIEPEYCSGDFCVFLPGASTPDAHYERLRRALQNMGAPSKKPLPIPEPFPVLEGRLSLRDAALADRERLPVSQAAGRVAATTVSPCPPGIPLVIPGETLTEAGCRLLKNCGIFYVNVVKSK